MTRVGLGRRALLRRVDVDELRSTDRGERGRFYGNFLVYADYDEQTRRDDEEAGRLVGARSLDGRGAIGAVL